MTFGGERNDSRTALLVLVGLLPFGLSAIACHDPSAHPIRASSRTRPDASSAK